MGRYSFLQLVAETDRAFVFLGAEGFRVGEIGLVILNEHLNRSFASLSGIHKSNKRARDVPPAIFVLTPAPRPTREHASTFALMLRLWKSISGSFIDCQYLI